MSNFETHFELQGRKGTNWTIIEAFDNQDEAMARANRIWDGAQYEGIKLTQESFNHQTNLFRSRELFHRGEEKKVSKLAQSKNVVVCDTVDSLYSGTGRFSIWEIMFSTLQENALIPTELLYNRKHYETLHAHGDKILGAVQRVAAVGGADSSIQKRIRNLWVIIDEAVAQVSAVEDIVPSLEMGRLLPIIQQLENHPRKKYLLTKSIVDYIAPAVTIEDKFGRVAIFLNGKRTDWAIAILDQILSEMLRHKGMLGLIFPNNPSLKQVCIYLLDLFRGELMPSIEELGEDENQDLSDAEASQEKLDAMAEKTARSAQVMKKRQKASKLFSPEILRLSELIEEDRLPQCKSVLYDTIVHILNGGEHLEGTSLSDECLAVNDILEKSRELPLGDADRIEINNLCERRIDRHLSREDISHYLGPDMNIYNRMNRLLDLEKIIPTEVNKRVISGFIRPIFELSENEKLLSCFDDRYLEKMQRLTRLQSRILRSAIEDPQRSILSEKLDKSCQLLIEDGELMEKLCGLPISIGKKGVRLLKLMNSGHFTKGHCLELANKQVYAWLKEDNFLESYTNEVPENSKEKVLAGLMVLVNKAQSGLTSKIPRTYPPLPDMKP